MYRFKLKEIEVGDTEIKSGKKSTVTDIDPETGAISWDVADAADFSSTYKALQKAKDFLDTLEKEGKAKDDTTIDKFSEQIANLFNEFRTHVRKNYPKEYERVSRLKESVNEQSEQWTQLDVININKSLRLALKTFNNLVRNLERLEGELGKHSNKPQGNLLQGMAPDSFDYIGVQNKLNKLYNAFSNAFSIDESVNEGHGLDQVDLDYLQHIANKNPDDTKLEKIVKFLTKSNILVDKTKDLSKGKEVNEDSSEKLSIMKDENGKFIIGMAKGKYPRSKEAGPFDTQQKACEFFSKKGDIILKNLTEERLNEIDINKLQVIGDVYSSCEIPIKEEEVEEGEGIGYLTPRAFNKNKKSTGAADIYYYKLGFKPVPKTKPKGFEVKQLFEYSDFQEGRINGFDKVEEKVNSISTLLSNAKNETVKFYNENPGSYAVVYSTDMVNELLDDIAEMLKQSK